jgi:pimeloyl-ACP methyl ester carboxylesterase
LELNGRKQWISLRGWDKDKPVLLFLAGGPGGTQMAAVRHELAELEKHFVIVNWDQPGSGKSYYAEKTNKITLYTYLQDGYALTEYLKKRFSQEKIYLIGESWGSALGIFLADRYPQSYHAFIGTGQMIDFLQTERMDYAKALKIAEKNGDNNLIKNLKANGEPPYYGGDLTWKSAVYLNFLSAYMANNPEIHNPGYNTIRDVCSSEYGLLDKINFFRGIIYTYNDVYQQLYEIDLREDFTKLDVPVYFFLGRHDVNAPTALVEEYEQVLDAPKKRIVWFEHSGHSPWINEREKFVEEVISCFLGD